MSTELHSSQGLQGESLWFLSSGGCPLQWWPFPLSISSAALLVLICSLFVLKFISLSIMLIPCLPYKTFVTIESWQPINQGLPPTSMSLTCISKACFSPMCGAGFWAAGKRHVLGRREGPGPLQSLSPAHLLVSRPQRWKSLIAALPSSYTFRSVLELTLGVTQELLAYVFLLPLFVTSP